MARVLVIGGTLFIGRALVEQLLERGDEVVIMHRGMGTPFGDRVGELRCDRNDPAAVRASVGGDVFEIVYDNVYDWQRGTTAAHVRDTALALARGLDRYVFMSSVAVYGGGANLDERDALVPDDHREDYGRNKANSERALFDLHRQQGLPATTLRPAFVYGPNNPFDREAYFWDRIVADRPVIIPGDGLRAMQWAHVDDVARVAIRAASEAIAIGHAYNIGNDPPVTQIEFVEALARAAGREVRLVHVPRARIVAAGGNAFVPPLYFGVYLDIPPIGVRVERVRSELGVELRPLEVGLRETFEWYQRQDRPPPDFSWEDQLVGATV